MVTVLLRLKGLTSAQHRDLLLATDECGDLWQRVRYKSSSHDKGGHNIDLKIETERSLQKSTGSPVLRDVPDKLWDILGIFPE